MSLKQIICHPFPPSLAEMRRHERENIFIVLQTGWKIKGVAGAAKLLRVRPTTLMSRIGKVALKRPTLTQPVSVRLETLAIDFEGRDARRQSSGTQTEQFGRTTLSIDFTTTLREGRFYSRTLGFQPLFLGGRHRNDLS